MSAPVTPEPEIEIAARGPSEFVPKRLWPLFRAFEPGRPAAVPLTDPDEIERTYRVRRRQVLISTIIGYALFYFVRKNLTIAMPVMAKDLGITKSSLGLFLTLHGVLYGVSKFANGPLADRSNSRTFMVVGLVASALMNVFFGLSSSVMTLGVFWMFNGWFQGMGFPACARALTHWFPPKQLATKMSLWNTSHSIGASLVVVLCGYLVPINWRLCFFVPAGLAFAASIYLWHTMADTPESIGLPEPEGSSLPKLTAEQGADFKAFLWKKVFCNQYIWIIGFANFFVYTIRYALLDWGPTLLTEAKGLSLQEAGWMVGSFEACGVAGMLFGGWITDRVFGGRGTRTCLFYMLLTGVSLVVFWKAPSDSHIICAISLCCAGFFIYGPQALIGIIAANLSTKRAAATGGGLTGMFGYASTVLSGWGLGTLVQHHGWDFALQALIAASVLGALLFAATWPAKAHGYDE